MLQLFIHLLTGLGHIISTLLFANVAKGGGHLPARLGIVEAFPDGHFSAVEFVWFEESSIFSINRIDNALRQHGFETSSGSFICIKPTRNHLSELNVSMVCPHSMGLALPDQDVGRSDTVGMDEIGHVLALVVFFLVLVLVFVAGG